MIENIKFRQLKDRIDSILSQLSGLSSPTMPRIGLLESLFKEFRHELSTDEENNMLKLFNEAVDTKNMVSNVVGPSYKQSISYEVSSMFMNEIERELRRLLDVYGHYKIKKEEIDHQVGEY